MLSPDRFPFFEPPLDQEAIGYWGKPLGVNAGRLLRVLETTTPSYISSFPSSFTVNGESVSATEFCEYVEAKHPE